jgi:hypothetical protein
MASKKKKKTRKGPTAKAKKAYIANIRKSYKRLKAVMQKHDPKNV